MAFVIQDNSVWYICGYGDNRLIKGDERRK